MSEEWRHPLDRLASQIGKNPAEVAAFDRFFAGLQEVAVARFKMEVSATNAARSMANFVTAFEDLDRRLTVQASAEIAAHPDLAHLNVQMDGFYDA